MGDELIIVENLISRVVVLEEQIRQLQSQVSNLELEKYGFGE